jgi:hypothetical protein
LKASRGVAQCGELRDDGQLNDDDDRSGDHQTAPDDTCTTPCTSTAERTGVPTLASDAEIEAMRRRGQAIAAWAFGGTEQPDTALDAIDASDSGGSDVQALSGLQLLALHRLGRVAGELDAEVLAQLLLALIDDGGE